MAGRDNFLGEISNEMTQILKNVHILTTGDETNDSALSDIVVLQDGTIESISPAGQATPKEDSVTQIDLGGKTISPAFFDGHMHLLLFGSSLLKIDIEQCRNLQEIRETIRREALARPRAPRLLVGGWMQHSTDGIALASQLDNLDPRRRPIFISAKDLHSTWCNTAALRELNVQDRPDPEGGTIHRDAAGDPSGLLSEAAAIGLVWPYLDSVTSREENLSYVREAIRTYNSAGYTGMVELATDQGIWDLLHHIRTKEPENYTVRVACHWLIKPSADVADCLNQVDAAIALNKQYNLVTSPDLRVAGIKLILDGVVDACTAALSEPYSHTTINGDMLWKAPHIAAVVERADRAGLQCALHAIGDRAVKIAVDAIESCGTSGRRHRIEHLELTSPEDAARLGQLGITASIQPVHSDPAILRAWPKLVGQTRCGRAFAYSEFRKHGAKLAIGTDSPTAPHMPFPNLHVATTRRSARRDVGDEEHLEPINSIPPLQTTSALQAATQGAAYSCFADGMAGSLEVGKSADFVVVNGWDGDEGMLGCKVSETWFKGRKVWPR